MISVKSNRKPQCIEVDSKAKFTLMARNDFDRLNLQIPIKESTIIFRSYSGNMIKPERKATVTVTYKYKQIRSELYIVPTGLDAL